MSGFYSIWELIDFPLGILAGWYVARDIYVFGIFRGGQMAGFKHSANRCTGPGPPVMPPPPPPPAPRQ